MRGSFCQDAETTTVELFPEQSPSPTSTRLRIRTSREELPTRQFGVAVQRQECRFHHNRLLDNCDIFHLCTSVICYCVSTALACTSAGRVSLKAKRCFHISHHIGLHRSAHCALTPTLVAEQVTAHFVNSRFAARANCTAAQDTCLFLGSGRKRRDLLASK